MSPWIQVYANLPSHRKTCKLRDALGLKNNYEAVGLLICLWTWMAVNAPSGSLTGFSTRDIADAAGYKKTPAKFRDALVEAGFLDQLEDGSLMVHDWDEHAGLLQDALEEQKRKTRDRVRKHREKKKAAAEKSEKKVPCSGNGNVTGNECNAPTKPNLTKPNLNVSVAAVVNQDGTAVTAAATADKKLEMMQGKLGKGVVALTDEQLSILLDKLGVELFDYYVDKLSGFIIQKGAKVKNHYATILKWWMEDSQGG